MISDNGTSYPKLALVSTRAAFGLWVLWKTDYTNNLINVVSKLYNPDRGWYEGRYESTGGYEETISISTNATVLEALLYKANGTLFKLSDQDGYIERRLDNEFTRPGHCFPREREACLCEHKTD